MADHKIYLIKDVETYPFSSNLTNLCQPPEITYSYKKKSVFESKKLKLK